MKNKMTIQQKLVGIALSLKISGHNEFAKICMDASEEIDRLQQEVEGIYQDQAGASI